MRITGWITILFFFAVIFLSRPAFGLEIKNGETITARPSNIAEDTAGVNALLKLYVQNYTTDIESAHRYASSALEISRKINYPKGLAYSNYYLAILFVDYDFELSETMLMEALKGAENSGDKLLTGKIYNIAGYLKNNLKQYEAALDFFDRSLKFFHESDNDSMAAAVYNNIAISYKGLDKYEPAIENYFKALKINEASGNYTWLATNNYNIGYAYLQIGDSVNGLNYLQKSVQLADEKGITHLRPYIYGAYGTHYLDSKNYKKALEYGYRELSGSRAQMNRMQERSALNLITQIYYEMGNLDSAFIYQKAVIAINDSINHGSQVRGLDFLKMKYDFQQELEQQQYKISLMEAEESRRRVMITIFILVAVILVLILVSSLVILQSRMKRKTLEQNALMLEKEKLSDQMEYKNKELTTNVMYLLNRNEFIASTAKKIASLIHDDNDPNSKVCYEILADLNKNTSKNVWKEFEVRFREVHGDFYNRLVQKFSNLSPNDLKLAAFMKLNMSTKEISAITFQTPETLKTARHRLRKKLRLSREDNLVAFLNQI